MNCCDANGNCNQGRDCPVRAARNSGVCCTEPDPELESMFWPTAAIVAFAAFIVLCFFGAAAHAGVI